MAIKKKKAVSDDSRTFIWPFGMKNYILFGVSFIVIVFGYICLGWGNDPNSPISLTLAPIILVIGYGLIPFAILAKDKAGESSDEVEQPKAE